MSVQGYIPVTIAFSADVKGGQPPYTVTWDFGDGSTGTGMQVTHTYTRAGTYTVKATARDAVGQQASASLQVNALAPQIIAPLQITITTSLTQQAPAQITQPQLPVIAQQLGLTPQQLASIYGVTLS